MRKGGIAEAQYTSLRDKSLVAPYMITFPNLSGGLKRRDFLREKIRYRLEYPLTTKRWRGKRPSLLQPYFKWKKENKIWRARKGEGAPLLYHQTFVFLLQGDRGERGQKAIDGIERN